MRFFSFSQTLKSFLFAYIFSHEQNCRSIVSVCDLVTTLTFVEVNEV